MYAGIKSIALKLGFQCFNILIDGIQHRNQDRGIVWINVSLGYRPLDLQVSNLLSTFIVGIYLIVNLCKLAIDRIQVIGDFLYIVSDVALLGIG